MRWTRSERADENFRDARTGGSTSSSGGRSGTAVGVGGMGIIGLILALLFGGNVFGAGIDATSPRSALDSVGGATATSSAPQPPVTDEFSQFLSFLTGDIQDFWIERFAESNIRYDQAILTQFDTPIQTGCGSATAAIGPHYCPLDKGIYLEAGFFTQILERRLGGSAEDFAIAYVVAHEFGHHVQNELGISTWVREQQSLNPGNANQFSVGLELQADCLAGVWAASAQARGMLESGDLAEALSSAAAVGDDRIQQSQGQRVNPHTWTHGSAAQREDWFLRGLETADTESCDTFTGF